ncbi:aspartate carbamoyltransferase [Paraburkholderia sp. MMS20-SJTN17]|uniref:Aspartate carbamoyltransferase n=1 Tax=Paraburkholderia translucens TaxID=2886945 RepID=A0ABS8KCM1_9BURK|nr:aspartate carbamoyltransferase [Paraburkholderia sp. MMS20-SJTN17]MCC8402487.1 aspartate carbamoyltransferase [Paraburkholderia sp. MMS20-SJTN17]
MKRPSACSIVASTVVLVGAAILSSPSHAEITARQRDVAQHGADVMPFSLAATTHIFSKTADGGIQQVVTKHQDPKQVALIRGHLAVIARQFSAGDFEAPEQIHGNDMPGLATLRTAKPGELQISYRDLPNGGELVYRTHEPRLVAALHAWFDAQLADHGHDAMAGHDSGMMHHHPMDTSAAE